MDQPATTFSDLCNILQAIGQTRGANAKIRLFAGFLAEIPSGESLSLAVQFAGEGAFTHISGRRASVGNRTSGLAAAEFCEIDYDLVFKPCRTAAGSSSEAIERLMDNIPAARQKRTPALLSLTDVRSIFNQLQMLRTREEKKEILHSAWEKMTPVEIKYFIRMLSQGSLRIGFETKSIVSSIAKAFQAGHEEVHYVHMITGSLGETAVLAKTNKLDTANFQLFHPLPFMLASPAESRSVEIFSDYVAEEKFDGMRAQIHAEANRVEIFSRDLNNITRFFPDIVDFFALRNLPATVFDGEICVFKDSIIQPFQMLQKRMEIKKPSKKIQSRYPVLFIAYDLLYTGRHPIFGRPLFERRQKLTRICRHFEIPVTVQFEISRRQDVTNLFARALRHGNEGLMLKKRDSRYEYGQRKKSWLKVKKPAGSLDTVIMYAHAGSGKRGGTYSDFTLGVSVKNDERYEEEFIPIGKAYGGYTNDELTHINHKIKELAVERYGPVLGLKPGIIIEVEFDDIQQNKRTKAGYTLRLPRFKAIRRDLTPADVNTLKDVEELYRQKLTAPRTPQTENPSFTLQ